MDDSHVATFEGNARGAAASPFERIHKLGKRSHVMPTQETRFTSDTSVDQAHGWAAHAGAKLG